MAVIKPFKGIRPSNNLAAEVISLPYDVMNREEAHEMAMNNPNSFLHISRSEIDLPLSVNPYSKEVYEKAKTNIEKFLEKSILIQDEEPKLYIYKQVMNGNTQVGIVGCFSVDDYQNNVIKKHELTRVEKEKDRINHFDICNANTEPVFLTYRKNEELTHIAKDYEAKKAPEFDITTKDGVSHTLWKIDEEEVIEKIIQIFSNIESLYIADGHHRSASAVKVGLKRRAENQDYTGNEEFNFFMAVAFPDEDLKIFDYNRVVKDLNGFTKTQFLQKVSEKFEVTKVGKKAFAPEKKHCFSMFLDGEWYKLTIKPGFFAENDVIKSLDVSILQEELLSPILGIGDPRTDKRIDFVGGIRGLSGLEIRVKEDMAVAFALYPVSTSDLLNVSDMDRIMPPKSTWFEPKLGSGLFMHRL